MNGIVSYRSGSYILNQIPQDMGVFQAGWHLIYTLPRQEKKVHTRLTDLGLNSFLPLIKKLRIWHDRKKYVDEPLFPSYVFVYLNDIRNYYTGIDIDGSLYYVRTGDKIARVSEVVVNNVKLATARGKELELSEKQFQPGRRFVICQGVLTGLNCEVVQVGSKQKLLVRVDLLKRNLLLTVPVESLMAV